MFKKLALSLSFIVMMGMLTACNPSRALHLNKTESAQPENQNTTEKTAGNDGIGVPVALPPKFATPSTNTPNSLATLSPMKGINVDTMFSENIKDTGDRFNRVESAVKDLRKEFEGYKPSIVRLAAVESDIQNLIKELEVLLQETPTPQRPTDLIKESEAAQLQVSQLAEEAIPPPQNVIPNGREKGLSPPPDRIKTPPAANPPDASAKTVKEVKKPPIRPKVIQNGNVAQNLRVGEHADKLRIVIDTNKTFKYSIDIDNEEKLIIVEIPDAKWVGKKDMKFSTSKLLESYTIEPINNDKGTMIIITLKKATSIIGKNNLTPDNTSPFHRIYFDLKM